MQVMAGLVIDIFVAFIVRWIVIFWRKAGSHRWPTVTGNVVRCHLEKPGYGCAYVVLSYKFKMNFERYHGNIKKPYIYDNYAEAYTRRFPAGSELRIHVDPNDPTRSCPVTV
jgi:hypothetical protein